MVRTQTVVCVPVFFLILILWKLERYEDEKLRFNEVVKKLRSDSNNAEKSSYDDDSVEDAGDAALAACRVEQQTLNTSGEIFEKSWWGYDAMIGIYKKDPPSLKCIPRIPPGKRLTIDSFERNFRNRGLPVIIPFSSLRHLGFETKALTVDELMERYPQKPNASIVYGANTADHVHTGKIDLRPALDAIMDASGKMEKMGKKRNFPRNEKMRMERLAPLGYQEPPLIRRRENAGNGRDPIFNLPSLWFGTGSRTTNTALHQDGGDNFITVFYGGKRVWILDPWSGEHVQAGCLAKPKGLCFAKRGYASTEALDQNPELEGKILHDEVKAGEMMYLPSGYLHAIKNHGPTIMINTWLVGCYQVGIFAAHGVEIERHDSVGFKWNKMGPLENCL